MAFIALNDVLGQVDLSIVDTAGPGFSNLTGGSGSGRQNFYNQVVAAIDPNLGGGEFVYLKYSGTITQGTVCQITPSISGGQIIMTATPWTGTANTGLPLCVAYAATGAAGQFGWFQIGGQAIVTTGGTPAAGNGCYYSASGTVQPTAVASKQMVNAQYCTAVSQTIGQGNAAVALSATQAVVQLNRPFAQGAIT